MAAGAWKLYNRAKRNIGAAAIDLGAGVLKVMLVTSASNFATLTLSTKASVDNEVSEANGYSSSGFSLLARTWTAGASAQQIRLDGSLAILTASGGAISNIKGAVLWVQGASAGARKLVAFASLTSSQFTLNDGSTLTISINANGLFNLT